MEISSAEYVWIGHIFEGHGVPKLESACSITLPLSTVRLKSFIEILSETLKHNFIPGLLTLGSTALIIHYQLLIEKLCYCPIRAIAKIQAWIQLHHILIYYYYYYFEFLTIILLLRPISKVIYYYYYYSKGYYYYYYYYLTSYCV